MEKIVKRLLIVFGFIASCLCTVCHANGINENTSAKYYPLYIEKNIHKWITVPIVVCAILAVFVVVLLLYTKHIKKQFKENSMTDAETGMNNLQAFKYHFKHTIDDESRCNYHIAYIVLDVSYLRSYHGGTSFEEALGYTSSVLSEYTGDKEIAARITENGFAFAFCTQDSAQAQKRLEKLMNKLNNFEGAKERNNKLVFHCAAYQLIKGDKNCEILLFNLRKNCNKIFGTGKQIVYCDVYSMNKVQEEKSNVESILRGFKRNEFKMYLQFIVDRKSKKIVSAEALSRWDSFEKGLIGPGNYIENMEATGLISKHDFYMFELVCRQLEKWKDTVYGDISISCNFTRLTLSEENFIDNIKNICNKYTFEKSKLAIEITEDAIEKDINAATDNVRLCKDLGFKIYLDDLGGGYTTLSNLCDYPIDVVKIDRDILLKTQTQKGRNLFDGIIALAHSLNIDVICEGVETESQNKLVSFSNCDYIQGWYYSKPIPSDGCETFINNYKQNHDVQKV